MGKKIFISINSILIVLIIYLCIDNMINGPKLGHLVNWDRYLGNLQTDDADYRVEIDKSDYGLGFKTIIHLNPVGEPSYVSITGYDDDNDGQWDKVSYCGNHELIELTSLGDAVLGCNSVVRTSNTDYEWKFNPCPADKFDVKPFSDEAIDFAINELNYAMGKIHNEDHLEERWKWNKKKKKLVRVFDKSNSI